MHGWTVFSTRLLGLEFGTKQIWRRQFTKSIFCLVAVFCLASMANLSFSQDCGGDGLILFADDFDGAAGTELDPVVWRVLGPNPNAPAPILDGIGSVIMEGVGGWNDPAIETLGGEPLRFQISGISPTNDVQVDFVVSVPDVGLHYFGLRSDHEAGGFDQFENRGIMTDPGGNIWTGENQPTLLDDTGVAYPLNQFFTMRFILRANGDLQYCADTGSGFVPLDSPSHTTWNQSDDFMYTLKVDAMESGQQILIDRITVTDLTAGPAGPSIYFVSAGTAAAPHESEGLLIDRLENVLGYSVNVVNQDAQNVADALTHDLIFVSESGSSGTSVPFMEEYRKSDVPFIMNELGGLTTALFGPDAFGAATSDIQNIKILDNSHFITENFSVGEIVEVRTSDVGIFVHINPGTSEATILAAANDGDDTQGAIVVMEVGDKFEDDVATTARVAFMFPHSTGVYLENYTAAGVELIDRVFTWALGLEPVDVPNPVDQQLWTFFE